MKELILIQAELKAPKNQYNSFGKYKYRSVEDILEAVKPLLLKYECTLIIEDEVKEVGGIVFIEATASIQKDMEGRAVTAQAGIDINRKGMDVAQSFGSSSSYARKYALNGLFLIDETEQDADHDNKKVEQKKPELILNSEVYKKAQEYMMSGGSIDVVKQKYSVSQEVEVALIKSI